MKDDPGTAESLVRFVEAGRFGHVIFDLDGTLTSLKMPWHEWTRSVVAQMPAEVRAETGRAIAAPGAAWGTVVNRCLVSGLIDYRALIELSVDFEGRYREHSPNWQLLEALGVLHQDGLDLSLWTSNLRSTAERVLAEVGALGYFGRIVARDDVWLSKPDPEGARLCGSGRIPSAALLVGDSSNDRLAAEASGVAFLDVSELAVG